MKDTVCKFAWSYPVLSLARNELRYCCRAKALPLSEDALALDRNVFKDFIPIVEMRRDLLNGVKTDSCEACWKIEEAGGKAPKSSYESFIVFLKRNLWRDLTYRQIHKKLLNLTDEEKEHIIHVDQPDMIEISLDNTCDLKCVYCNHYYSSRWAVEKLKYNELDPEYMNLELPKVTDTKYEDAWWRWFEDNAGYSASYINFIGGEPLLTDKFYQYLNRIIHFYETRRTKHRRIVISVVSNFNTPDKLYDKFIEAVRRIVISERIHLDVNVSCESLGARSEFIRNGSDWSHIEKNVNKFLNFIDIYDPDQKHITFNLQIALNSLCISDLPNFFRYVVELQRKTKHTINLRQNQVVYPEWCSPYILPESYITYIDDAISILEEEYKVNGREAHPYGDWVEYIKFLKSIKNGIKNPNKSIKDRADFALMVDRMCDRRGLDFHVTFPEMIPFYDECKKLPVTPVIQIKRNLP